MYSITFIVLLMSWLFFIFYNSSQPYQAQTIIPQLQQLFQRETLIAWLPNWTISYGDTYVQAHAEPYDFVEFIVRKLAHVAQYAVCGLFAAMLFGRIFSTTWKYALSTIGLAVCIALLDEFNQSFNPNRTGNLWDVGIDTFGAVLGLLCYWLGTKIVKRSKR